ncbi:MULTISPECIES: CoA ester lyase [unclassified Rhodococcus (in: high G+C Gram-positive bacteria)]|uniref:HpcH/HpaI aldolase/citrate lyase family protein n=1 Tax=unclassified Rhodococcus (in: high G+C Gram-positive bacteria) TaxID=192944 RepID=UPI001639CFF2|nr:MULTISPECIES: aldolase/citrate lyase family protein [unclassified Rhodococcus (in: high G+C Gram-positive bacteria)]MBC2638050.1 CoA ester lyase [Rhodococcus sp. 3A]MBC2897203.1 CoA ester lyase [Rhodococcus sp. 4CII]
MSVETVRTGKADIAMARSWLLVPAIGSETIAAAAASGADALIIDLEDGLPFAAKEKGRACAAAWLERHTGWVRIGDATTAHWRRDLDAIRGLPGLQGLMLSKTETPEQVRDTAGEMPGVPIVALVESAAAIVVVDDIARTRSVVRLAFGIGDYCRDIGAGRSPMALAYARSRLVNASRAAQIGPPVDGPTLSPEAAVVRDDTRLAREMGMTGKLTLAGEQVPVINTALAPDTHDISWAEATIERLGADGARVTHGGHLPQLARAHDILRRAEHFTPRP